MTEIDTDDEFPEDTPEIAALRAAQEEWLRAHPYGDQDENGIDLSLIRANLKLTPSERFYKAQRTATLFVSFREAGKNAGL